MDDFKTEESIALYKSARPAYPKELYSGIMDWLSNGSENRGQKFLLAVDIGCGAGQSTSWLCQHFEEVIGIDPSEEQVEAARKNVQDKHNNVTFRTGVAHDLSFLEDNSVDLITAGVALHWFRMVEFCREAHRVLRPGGALAAFCHDFDKDMTLKCGRTICYAKDVGHIFILHTNYNL